MYLSHSQVEMFQQCQLKWSLVKIQKAPQAPSTALVLGSAFHTAIEYAGKQIIATGELATFNDLLPRALQEINIAIANDATGFLARHESEMHDKLYWMVKAFVQDILPQYKPLSVEEMFTTILGGVQFTGRIDAKTTTSIIDFKTGKAWADGAEHGKGQASAYLAAFPYFTWVTFYVFPVEFGECHPQELRTSRTIQQIRAYRQMVKDTAKEIELAKKLGDFKPDTGPLCAYCPVLGSCSHGIEWLKSRGRDAMVPLVK